MLTSPIAIATSESAAHALMNRLEAEDIPATLHHVETPGRDVYPLETEREFADKAEAFARRLRHPDDGNLTPDTLGCPQCGSHWLRVASPPQASPTAALGSKMMDKVSSGLFGKKAYDAFECAACGLRWKDGEEAASAAG